jgi:hypothetical protein
MLLTHFIRRIRRSDDRGVALAAVLGLMSVGLILTSLVAASVINSAGFSTSTRAGVQSQAAAEAGIAAARAGLIQDTCVASGNGIYQSASGVVPSYLATVWIPSGGSWVRGCPVGLSTSVRLLSSGYASSTGVNGVDAGNSTNLEAILSPAVPPTAIVATGPAVYAYNAGSFGNGGELVSLDGSTPNVLIKTGNITCDNNFEATANLVVNGGNLTIDNGCNITGNVWASGRVDFVNSGIVGGSAVGNGVSMANSSQVGSIWSTADLTLSGNPVVNGAAKAYSLVPNGGTMKGGGYIYGPTNLSNASTNLTANVTTQTTSGTAPKNWNEENKQLVVVNPITTPTFGSDYPSPPTVPNWIDFGADARDYTIETWVGFGIYTMDADCDVAHVIAAVESFAGGPGVIDGRACVGGLVMDNNNDIPMENDLAIIAPSITISGSVNFSPTITSRLWLINPDATGNGLPTCAAGEGMEISNNPSFDNVKTLIYTPCVAAIVAGIEIVGQIFANEAQLTNNSTLAYAAVGLPGYDLNYGTSTTTVGSEAARSVQTLRNVMVGN